MCSCENHKDARYYPVNITSHATIQDSSANVPNLTVTSISQNTVIHAPWMSFPSHQPDSENGVRLIFSSGNSVNSLSNGTPIVMRTV